MRPLRKDSSDDHAAVTTSLAQCGEVCKRANPFELAPFTVEVTVRGFCELEQGEALILGNGNTRPKSLSDLKIMPTGRRIVCENTDSVPDEMRLRMPR